MKILDDLAVCRQRARLRAQAPLQTGYTQPELAGKRSWSRLRPYLESAVRDVFELGGRCGAGVVLRACIEKPVSLTVVREAGDGGSWVLVLNGVVDFLAVAELCGRFFSLLLEVTEYRGAPEVVRHRLQAYASAVYGELGLPVVPVLVVMKDEDAVEDVLVMKSRTLVPGVVLKRVASSLVETISSEGWLRPSSYEVCAFCEPSFRSICEYAHEGRGVFLDDGTRS